MTNWKTWVVMGVLAFIFGLLALGNTAVTSLAITIVLGVLFAIMGAVQIWAGFFAAPKDSRLFSILWGLLSLLIGISFIANPVEGTLSLTMVVTAFLLASGVLRLVMAWQMRSTPFFWSVLFSGAVTVFLGGYILSDFAAVSLSLLGIFLGVELLVDGAALVGFGLFLRSLRS